MAPALTPASLHCCRPAGVSNMAPLSATVDLRRAAAQTLSGRSSHEGMSMASIIVVVYVGIFIAVMAYWAFSRRLSSLWLRFRRDRLRAQAGPDSDG
jgi:hypothetical protein